MYVAKGGLGDHIGNDMKHHVITYLVNEKGYDRIEAELTYDGWAKHDNLVYGIPEYEYEKYVNKYRKIVGLPPLEDSHKGSRKGSRKGDALAQQIIGDNVEEDPDGYNFYDAREALRKEGYSEDEIEDNIDTWMYQHMN